MTSFLSVCLLICALAGHGWAQPYIAFDSAKASSTYSAGNLAGSPDFAALRAVDSGSGYWCSAGNHAADQTVSWSGVLDVRRKAIGLKINWAYSPGEVKILTSPDGANFEEARCWTPSSRDGVAYEESVMFESVRNIRAVTIAMRGPKEWQYFGINEAVLIGAGNEPFMLISGVTSEPDEQCLTTHASALGLTSCTGAIASGSGDEIFQFNADGQLTHGDDCVVVEGGITSGGGAVGLGNCEQALRAGDGRSLWEVTGDGQLRMAGGSFCLSQTGSGDGQIHAGRADASSTSSGHEASFAVDGDEATYWASAADPVDGVALTLDLDGQKRVDRVEISWEQPATAFDIELASGGGWVPFFSTSGNALTQTVALGASTGGSSLRIRMTAPHPSFGSAGHVGYGIRAVRIYGSGLRTVVQDCGEASHSQDASDKWFQSAVADFDGAAQGALSGYSLLTSAADALGAVTTQLQGLASNCGRASVPAYATMAPVLLQQSLTSDMGLRESDPEEIAVAAIASASYSDTASLRQLVDEARRAISAAHASL